MRLWIFVVCVYPSHTSSFSTPRPWWCAKAAIVQVKLQGLAALGPKTYYQHMKTLRLSTSAAIWEEGDNGAAEKVRREGQH